MTTRAAPPIFPFPRHRTMAAVMEAEQAYEACLHDMNNARRIAAGPFKPGAILFAEPCSSCGKRTACSHRRAA